ncbi:ROK family transcriptional regulator [Allokutzneria sp. A3M-2-11 16]|uniref:ROK family transcriptional regulator n=1 Tax=Allokutzneria sp. A3M-2-11 16 TaxID=2962043 RepID=UPI0020B7E36A|nr:ROK family transcriptional regulator [Allokutzneria sp. A3M-2-11 16]MCP3804315.1 ROK family transcriptional regulator [Allokutzneria sp. A3M-2-11 16]
MAAGVNLDVVRDHNSALVLSLVRRSGELSRVQVAEHTGLTGQAISKIIARLLADGLVREGRREVHGRGKPRTMLRLVGSARHALGAHIDRDELRLVLVDLTGEVVASRARTYERTPLEPETAVGMLADMVAEMVAEQAPAEITGLGIGLPGPLDHTTGTVLGATHLPGWDKVPLAELAAERTGLPVLVDKDTNTAILAENWDRGDTLNDAALVYVGTGIGAGLVLGGRIHRGARTNAGEFGHTTLSVDGPLCACGRRGCVEALCGPATIGGGARSADEAVVWTPEAGARFTAVCAAARDGDPDARRELATAARTLGVAAADLVALLDIDVVLLGGRALRDCSEIYLDEVSRALHEQEGESVVVSLAGLDPDQVATGAARLVLARTHYATQ